MTQRLLQYGAQKNPAELSEILAYIFERNNELASRDERGTPVCIWGTHGLGKTQLVQDFAKKEIRPISSYNVKLKYKLPISYLWILLRREVNVFYPYA